MRSSRPKPRAAVWFLLGGEAEEDEDKAEEGEGGGAPLAPKVAGGPSGARARRLLHALHRAAFLRAAGGGEQAGAAVGEAEARGVAAFFLA